MHALSGFLDWWGFWRPKRDRWYAAWEFNAWTGDKEWVYNYGPIALTDEDARNKYLDTREIYWNGGARMWTKQPNGTWKLELSSA